MGFDVLLRPEHQDLDQPEEPVHPPQRLRAGDPAAGGSAPDGMGVIQKVMDEDGVGLRVTLSYKP
jgi:hypothetical protein